MRRLKRAGRGRAAVVVPHGTLFGDGISARIKADLLEKFNLHTVVRLREGVFAPYTDIPANLIFFDTTGPTKDIWYYEMPLPEGRKKYSKTAPMAYEEFADCLAWWKKREPNERAWKVSAADLIQRDAQDRVVACNLDIKNPHSGEVADHRAPAEIVDAILRPMWEIAPLVRRPIETFPDHPEVGIRSCGRGAFHWEPKTASELGEKRLFEWKSGDLLLNIVFAWEGAVAVATEAECQTAFKTDPRSASNVDPRMG